MAMRPIGKSVRDLAADLGHGLDGHGLVALVFEVARGPALGVVARHALEVDERSVLAAQQLPRDRTAVDGIAGEREEISRVRIPNLVDIGEAPDPPLTGGRNATSSPSASGASTVENS